MVLLWTEGDNDDILDAFDIATKMTQAAYRQATYRGVCNRAAGTNK